MKALVISLALITLYDPNTIICSISENSYHCEEYRESLPDSYGYDTEYLEDVIHVHFPLDPGDDRHGALPYDSGE